jgi:hypothetical protein
MDQDLGGTSGKSFQGGQHACELVYAEQVVSALNKHGAGAAVAALCRQHDIRLLGG